MTHPSHTQPAHTHHPHPTSNRKTFPKEEA
jgi:hypothetical protein